MNPGPVQPARRPGPPPSSGSNFWQVLAILALIAATAGWTTVGVIALRAPSTAVVASPTDSFDPNASDGSLASDPPIADTHDAPQLEAVLPTTINGTTLASQSWTAAEEGILNGDEWSASMTKFLTTAGKTSADLLIAQAIDPNQGIDVSIAAYQIAGTQPSALRDALVAAWKSQYAQMTFSEVTLAGKTVTKGVGTDLPSSYLYLDTDVVYDIETTDEALALAALGQIPPVASGAPASGAPAASPATSDAPAPS
ncbi:MAG: hypothetical protein ABI553_01795 [Chloroflexota bacterium]